MCAAKLSIPRQFPGGRPAIGSTVAEARAWIGALPAKDAEKAARILLPALVEFNRRELAAEPRYQVMRLLTRVSEQLVRKLRAKYLVGNSQMVTWKGVQDSELVKRLLQETAIGFKILVDAAVRAANSPAQKEGLGCAILHAMHCLGDYLLEHYLLYEPVAGGTWGELNLLYRIAERHGLEQWPLTLGEEALGTIEETYQRALLLSAINPYRLLRTDVEGACAVIGDWARQCRLEKREPGWEPAGEIVIDLASDRAPEFAKAGEYYTDLATIRLVNLEGIGQGAEGMFHLHDPGDAALAKIRRDLLQHLRIGWRSDIQRSSVRRSSFAEMELAIGLRACHQLFGGERLRGSGDLLSLEALCQEHDSAGQDPDLDAERAASHVVKQMDVSMGGYGLRLNVDEAARVRQGDLLSVRMVAMGETPWRIGDVRWKRTAGDHSVMLGVRMLAESAEAFYATAVSSSGLEGSVMRGLLIPADGFENPSACLLLPAESCDEGGLLRVRTPERRLRLKLLTRLDAGAGFARFSYEIVPDL